MRCPTILALSVSLLVTGCEKPSAPPAAAAPTVAVSRPAAADVVAQVADPQPAAARAEPPPPAATRALAEAYTERTRQLLEAAEKGRVSLLMDLLKKGADVNDKDDDGQTALHKAATGGHKSVVVVLLLMGADMGERDAKGRTPFMAAAAAGNSEVLNVLMTPDRVKSLAGDALGLAGKELKLNLDAAHGRLLNAANEAGQQADPEGQTALMLAAAGGHVDCVRLLMGTYSTAGVRPRVLQADKKGRNALMMAAAGGHAEVIDALSNIWSGAILTLEDLRRTDAEGKTALDLAEAGNHKLAVKRLWQEQAQAAAAAGDLATVKSALEKYPNDVSPTKLLRSAAQAGAEEVVRFFLAQAKDKPTPEKLRLLGAVGTSPWPGTALHAAVLGGHRAIVQALLDRDWWKDREGPLALIAYKSEEGGTSILPVMTNNYLAEKQPEMVKLVGERLKQLEGEKK